MFHVGQRVKYVGKDYSRAAALLGQTVPVHGAEYTVRNVGVALSDGLPAIRLNEIVNATRTWIYGVYELWMNAEFFRPLVERKTSIEIFTKMLKPSEEPVVVCSHDVPEVV